LVKAYSGCVFAVCLGLLGNRHDAEDAAQQTLLRGFVEIEALRDSERFGAWVVRIARNLCLDVLRRRKHERTASAFAREQVERDMDDGRLLENALNKLSPRYRVPLLLFYFDGRSTQTIAETLGVSQANVQARLSRARRQLRRLLEREGDHR